MILQAILLQHFRNYSQQRFGFSPTLTVVVGPNTAGKTNLSEAIHLLLTGKSFRAANDADMIAFGEEIARVGGLITEQNVSASNAKQSHAHDEIASSSSIPRNDTTKLEVVIASSQATGGRQSKKFLINGVGKSRSSLQGLLPLVLFRPEELDIILDGPSLRRTFLDDVLEQVDKSYAAAHHTYDRSLRQRNALLRIAKETGKRHTEQFAYWDDLLIASGMVLMQKREALLQFINQAGHDIFPLQTVYDKSTISRERLDQYRDAEIGAGATLVGPHRDDFLVTMPGALQKDVRYFGSRGQSRLAVLQLKMLQIAFIDEQTKTLPLLVLDDIFSELDNMHIKLVLEKVQGCQVILTTTHKEFVPAEFAKRATVIELENK